VLNYAEKEIGMIKADVLPRFTDSRAPAHIAAGKCAVKIFVLLSRICRKREPFRNFFGVITQAENNFAFLRNIKKNDSFS
jgi:hypothetical protein